MTLIPDLEKLTDIVQYAGEYILLPYFEQQNATQLKHDGSIVTQADVACQSYLQEQLHNVSPTIAFLGEEMTQLEQSQCLQSQDFFWCVDPLDGTSNFMTPMPLFSISVALIQAGKPILACVYDPVRKEMFTAIQGQGIYLNGKSLPQVENKPLQESVGFLDFKRLPDDLAITFATQNIYRSQRNLGTCALEWAWLAAGRAQFIIHGGEKLWDYAAGILLAEEAGCVVSDFSGTDLFAKQGLSSSILAAPDSLHPALLAYLKSDVDEEC